MSPRGPRLNSLRSPLARTLATLALLIVPMLAYAAPTLFFSDLDSGPNTGGQDNNGVFVTVWGKGFGSSGTVTVGGGQVARIVTWAQGNGTPASWSLDKVTFQLGPNAQTGTIVVHTTSGDSNGIPFTVRSGRIFFVTPTGNGNGNFATPMSPFTVYTGVQPGDTYYFRAGTYSGQYGDPNWVANNYTFGAAQRGNPGNPIALVGYPGEVATFISPGTDRGNIGFNNSGPGVGGYTTIANLTLVGREGVISGGGFYTNAKSGAPGIRIVGSTLSATYTGNTMSGLIVFQADGWRILGNEIKNTGVDPQMNNNHAIYVTVASSDVDIGWNYLHNLKMGHVIQVHTDPAPGGGGTGPGGCYTFTDVRIHDNLITATSVDDSRGINVANACPGTYGVIYNNVLSNLGQDFSAIIVGNGSWKVYNNTLYNIHATSANVGVTGMLWVAGTTTIADVRNNIFYSDGLSPYIGLAYGATISQVTLSNNLYHNNGAALFPGAAAVNANPLFINPAAGNFQLQTGSPAIDKGANVNTVVSMDHDGGARPQGAAYDIGAYESSGPSLPRPQNLSVHRN